MLILIAYKNRKLVFLIKGKDRRVYKYFIQTICFILFVFIYFIL
jgi:hypothetical protein